MASNEEELHLIVDLGSGSAKVGLSDDDMPRAIVPTLFGTVRKGCQQVLNADSDKVYVGADVVKNSGILDVGKLVEGGIVSNWEVIPAFIQMILTHVVHNDAENLCLLITEPPNNPVNNGLEGARVFFSMGFPAMQRVIQGNMVLYSNGMTTGCVLDSGAGCTHIMPVYQGYTDKRSGGNTRVAGNNIDRAYVKSFGTEHGKTDLQTAGNAIYLAQDLKEKTAYISMDYDTEILEFQRDSSKNIDYTLPDGQVLSVGASRIQCPEVLFRPGELMGLTDTPVGDLIHKSYLNLNIEMRQTMMSSMILSGGTSMTVNFPDKINAICLDMVAPDMRPYVKITSPEMRKLSVWVGAGILASLSHYSKCLIRREEYEEEGDAVVIRKSLV